MNTKQMIALWYTGLAAVAALLAYAGSAAGHGPEATFPLLPVLGCIAIVGGLLIATFRTSEEIDQKRVLLYSLAPPAAVLVALIGIAVLGEYLAEEPEPYGSNVSTSKIDLVDPRITLRGTSGEGMAAILRGRIRNTSAAEIGGVSINAHLHEISAPETDTSSGVRFGEWVNRAPVPVDSFGSAIDGHTFRVYVDVPPRSTRSFTTETDPDDAPTIRPPDNWEWSYEIRSVH